MQARTLTFALLTTGIAACSQSADNTKAQVTSSSREQELALTAAPAVGAVVSPIETSRPGLATEATAPRATLAARERATKPAVEARIELPDVDTHIHESPATAATAAVTEVELIALPSSGPRASPSNEEGTETGGRVPAEPATGRPGIIIRGGHGGTNGRDPCDLHDPLGGGRSVPPVLINPRIPGTRLPGASDGGRAPAGPRRGVGGGIRF